ncbi:MAG: archaellin/type IV pilin N-terminal domain-containing protein [Candidatus Altiarchaeia archaeon]
MKNFKSSNKGETGIGTLIIFISVVLVAAIAASVLLGTAGSLQQKALTTGKQTQQEVSSGIQVISVTAQNGTDGSLDNFEILAKLSAGSDSLALNDTVISFDTKSTTQNLKFQTGSATSGTDFIVSYVKEGPDHLNNYLTVGDVVKIEFNSSSSIGQSQTVRTRIIPKHGVIVPVNFVTPDVISTYRVNLYP